MINDTTARGLLDRVQNAAAGGEYTEELFKESVCFILDENGVEYEAEYAFGPGGSDSSPRRCDIYIPGTDTAIELKLEATMRGVGQCVYYTRYCREAVLLADGDPPEKGHNAAVRDAVEVASGVHYGLCIPGLAQNPTCLDIRSSDKSEFYFQAAYGDLGDRDFVVLKDLGSPDHYSGLGDDAGENSVNTRGKWVEETTEDEPSSMGGLYEFAGGGRHE